VYLQGIFFQGKLGYENIQNFDASLMGWAPDLSLPMESNYDFFVIGSPVAGVNSAQLNLSAAPFVEDGQSFVAADILADSLGAKLTISDDNIVLSSDEKTLEVTSRIVKDDVTFLPVRQVAEAFGATVGWDGEKKEVSIFLP